VVAARECELVEERVGLLAQVVCPTDAVLRASLAAAEELLYGSPRAEGVLALALDRARAVRRLG
jgi:hypothetical protein